MELASFTVSKADSKLIDMIAERATNKLGGDVLNLLMDITATHANGCELRLRALLTARDADFFHDIMDISAHINRISGKLGNFSPRYSV